MARKHKPEEIIGKLREAEIVLAQGGTVAQGYPLDLARTIAMGHSSGGHLALWLAGRANLKPASPLFAADPLRFKGVLSIAGVNDLEHALEHGGRTDILQLIGSPPGGRGRLRIRPDFARAPTAVRCAADYRHRDAG